MVGGAAALGLIALAELVSRHPTRNVAAAMHHMTRGPFALEWWTGVALAAAVPVALGWLFLAGILGPVPVALGGAAACAGIWFADDAFVKAGQSVPLS